jgi:two-component system CheB/CheR fusion protein
MTTTSPAGQGPFPAGRPLSTGTAGQRALCVLVADGDRDTADSVAMLVTMWGHAAVLAYDGADALRLALAHRPDVLVMDVAMPGLSGCEVARRARREGRLAAALVVAVTGHAGAAHRLRAAEAGFDRYLLKPACPLYLEALLQDEWARLAAPTEALPPAVPPPRAEQLLARMILTGGATLESENC